jgi:hypothetical protein
MTSEKISSSVQQVHERIAFKIANQYITNLQNDTNGTFGTLDAMLHTFRFEIAEQVHHCARVFRASQMKYRPTLLSSLARSEIRMRLRGSAELTNKLAAIRAAQKAKAEAEISAECATWVPFPKSAA